MLLLVVILLLSFSCSASNSSSSVDILQMRKHTFHPQFDQYKKKPAILVIPQEDNIARKLSLQGYVAMTMRFGEKTFKNILNDREKLDRIKKRVLANLTYLKSQPDVDPNRIGVIGYSLGGYFATYLASQAEEPGIRAAVLYYGLFDTPKEIQNLRVPVLAFMGDADTRIPIQWSLAMREVAIKNRKQLDFVIYRNANHEFEYGLTPADWAAAEDAWKRTSIFLEATVKR